MIGKEGSKHELTCCIFLYYSKKNCSRAFLSHMVWQCGRNIQQKSQQTFLFFPDQGNNFFRTAFATDKHTCRNSYSLGNVFLLVFSMSNSTPTVYFSSNRFLSRIHAYILTVQYCMHMHNSFFNPQPIMLRKQMQKTSKIKQIQFL